QKQLVDACPYGVVYWNEEKQLAQKCTLCAHRLDEGKIPRCVQVCPSGCLTFGDLDDPESAVSRLLAERQGDSNAQAQALQKGVRQVWERHQWTARLQSTILGAPQGLDYRWLYLAARCVALVQEIDRQLDGVSRVARLAPAAVSRAGSLCAMAARATEPASSQGVRAGDERRANARSLYGVADELERAGRDGMRGLENAQKVLPDVDAADRLLAGVLADLNTPYLLRWPSTWGHVASLEAFLLHATSRLQASERRLAVALCDASRARARVERVGIDLAWSTALPGEQEVFRGLAQSRLQRDDGELEALLGRGFSLGDAAVMLLYARRMSRPALSLQAARRPDETWIEVAERMGAPADLQAIVLRLLHLNIMEERFGG
ncbi:MAG: hypothetical protein QHJ73_11020, partial [Armatimonadota bacterium]|nr:hypothetical protein [Armatimonadota bacterium]